MGDYPTIDCHSTRAGTREHLFCIRGWAAWAPGRETESSWRHWAGTQSIATAIDGLSRPPAPAILRRRVSHLGQEALRAAWGLTDIRDSRVVLASRHGEFGRTLSILDSLVMDGGVSPADFTLSVHHALIGLLSIATNNHQGHTAIAGGSSSFGLGFVEALACLVERPTQPVVLVYYDEGLPAPFDCFNETPDQPLAMALTLATDESGEIFGLTTVPGSPDTPQSAQALDFLRFMLTDTPKLSSCGEHLEWQWRRHAAAA